MTQLPLLSGYQRDGVVAWQADRRLSAGRTVNAARRLAAVLPRGQYAINLCESTECFLIAALATLIAHRTIVLPPSRLPRTLAELHDSFPDSICLADAAPNAESIAVAPWIDAALSQPDPGFDSEPTISGDHPAAILFTSGSTGAPRMHLKTWGELVAGTTALTRSIARPQPDVAIVGTVPPQHMFGLETTVMLPLQTGTPLITRRPAFAGDLEDLLEGTRGLAQGGIWLMTTPLQLRAFHRAHARLAGISNVIASTMPLDAELARAVERDWRAQVHEIYGCTEGGILAVRRPGVATAWTPAAGLTFVVADDGSATVSGGHLRGTLTLSDRLRSSDAGNFELAGRAADLVKIGGKRASLAALTRELLSLAGVEDGVVFLPQDDAPRVAALAVAPERTVDDLRLELAQRIDVAYLPRPFLLVDALPRNAAGKLPLPELREYVATLRRSGEGNRTPRTLTSQTTFSSKHPALEGHFPERPIVPAVLLLTSVEDVLREAGLRVVGCTKAKFSAPVVPGKRVTIRVDVETVTAAHFEICGDGHIFATGTLRCEVMEAAL